MRNLLGAGIGEVSLLHRKWEELEFNFVPADAVSRNIGQAKLSKYELRQNALPMEALMKLADENSKGMQLPESR
jgi:hypothetical protein